MPEKTGGEFGVEDLRRLEVLLPKGGQVLAGGVEDPGDVSDRLLQRRQIAHRRRVDEEDAGTAPVHLDEIRPLRVAEA